MKKFILGTVAGWFLCEATYTTINLIKYPDSKTSKKIKLIYGAIPLACKDPEKLTDDEKIQLMQVTNRMF